MQTDQPQEHKEHFQTRDQRFALEAYERVTDLNNRYRDQPTARNRYGAISHLLPILIHTSGLAQAISFATALASKPDDTGIYKDFLNDLAQTVGVESGPDLQNFALDHDLGDYLHLTRDVLDALLWYKRFAQSILHVDDANVDDVNQGGA
jgi:CRISPR-associated protein Cmr5